MYAFADTAGERETRSLDHFIRGTIADEMEDYYRAVFHYQEALRLDSSSAFVYVALAQDYILLSKISEALALLNRTLALHPDYIPAIELQFEILRGTGQLAAARTAVKRLTELQPNNREHERQLLALELSLGHFDDVERLYAGISKGGDESLLIGKQILAIYLASNDIQRAVRLLEQLVRRDSTDASLVFALGTSYLQTGDSLRGQTYIEKANRLEPSDPRYWNGRIYLALDRQDNTAAILLCDSALELSHPTAALHNMRGTALNRMGRKTDAIEELSRALELDSTQFGSMGTLALIYDELDSVEQAVHWYEHAISLSDSAPVYLNNLAYTYAQRGLKLDRARKLSLRAVTAEPKNGAYLDTMGWIEFGLGNYRAAVKWLKKALKATSNDATTFEHLGDTYTKLGSLGKAKVCYRRALELSPSNEILEKKLAQ